MMDQVTLDIIDGIPTLGDSDESFRPDEFDYDDQSSLRPGFHSLDQGEMNEFYQTMPNRMSEDPSHGSYHTGTANTSDQRDMQYNPYPAGNQVASMDCYETGPEGHPPHNIQEFPEPPASGYAPYPVLSLDHSIIDQRANHDLPALAFDPLLRYANESGSWVKYAPVLDSQNPAELPIFRTRSSIQNERYLRSSGVESVPDHDLLHEYQELQAAPQEFRNYDEDIEMLPSEGPEGIYPYPELVSDPRRHCLSSTYLDLPSSCEDSFRQSTFQYLARDSGESSQTGLSQGMPRETVRLGLVGPSPDVLPGHGTGRSPLSHAAFQVLMPDNYPGPDPFVPTGKNSLVGSSQERNSSLMGHNIPMTGYVNNPREVGWNTDSGAMVACYAGAQDSCSRPSGLLLDTVVQEAPSNYRSPSVRVRRPSAHPLQNILPASGSPGNVTTSSEGDQPNTRVYREYDRHMNAKAGGRTRHLSPDGRRHASAMRRVGVCDDCRRKRCKVSL